MNETKRVPREFWIVMSDKHPVCAYDIEEKQAGIFNIENKKLVHVREVFDEPVDPYAELKKAHKEGKIIQCANIDLDNWNDCGEPVWCTLLRYRIKPELPYRPWKPEEVPVWAVYRHKMDNRIYYPSVQGPLGVSFGNGSSGYFDCESLRLVWEHSLDHGKTWLPCGVLEK